MNDSEIIVALGDTGTVAEALSVLPSRVSNWKARGIPWRFRPTIASLAKRKRVSLPDGFLSA